MSSTRVVARGLPLVGGVSPLFFRTVTQAFELSGYRIPAGEHVIIAAMVPLPARILQFSDANEKGETGG